VLPALSVTIALFCSFNCPALGALTQSQAGACADAFLDKKSEMRIVRRQIVDFFIANNLYNDTKVLLFVHDVII
jgi:hypothetical protein